VLPGAHWSEIEVQAIVGDYFAMLEKELRGIPYNKTEHRRALRPLLAGRSDGSIERKHQNISAVLLEVRFPYIRGYKPLSQYQQLLADEVLEFLEEDVVLHQLALAFVERPAATPPPANLLDLMTSPPDVLECSVLPRLQRSVYQGIEAADRGELIEQEEVERRMGKWLGSHRDRRAKHPL
jgi:hypothetical protein